MTVGILKSVNRTLQLKSLKNSLTIFLLIVGTICLGQTWSLKKTISTDQEISAVSIDSKGMFYAGTTSGNIIRYDSLGEEDEYFSQLNNSSLTTIQAWNRLKVFTFFREQQTVAILDRFTTTPRNIFLRDLGLQYAWLFAPGVDNSYWALSTKFKELIKYDDQNLNILFRIILPKEVNVSNASYLRAYKNLLVLVDEKSGLWFFDQYGVLQGNLEISGIHHIQFLDNQILAFDGSEIITIDPFGMKVLERKKAPGGAFRSVVIRGDWYIFFSDNQISMYQLN